jgi:uncharacterized membrane protein YtjA (UPF0391 family)
MGLFVRYLLQDVPKSVREMIGTHFKPFVHEVGFGTPIAIALIMIRAAIGFFILAIFSIILGLSGVAGLSMEIAKILVSVFIVLAVISFGVSLVTGKRIQLP